MPDEASAYDVSVLIPARNAAEFLADQLEALAKQSYTGRWELVVVDNGSTDETPTVLATWRDQLPQLRIVRADGPANASRARNLAAASATAPLLVFCDADDVADPHWLESLVRATEEADVVAGVLDVGSLNDDMTRYWRSFAMPTSGTPAFGYLPYAVSANMAVTATAFGAAGGFDDAIPGPGSEEIDLCWRLQQSGHRFAVAADATMAYRFRAGLRPFVRQQFRYGQGEAALFARHRPHMQRASKSDAAHALWFAVSRCHHILRGAALRGRYLGYVAYRLGRVVGGVRVRRAYW